MRIPRCLNAVLGAALLLFFSDITAALARPDQSKAVVLKQATRADIVRRASRTRNQAKRATISPSSVCLPYVAGQPFRLQDGISGLYVEVRSVQGYPSYTLLPSSMFAQATLFTLQSNGNVAEADSSPPAPVGATQPGGFTVVLSYTPAAIYPSTANSPYAALVCSTGSGGSLSCTVDRGNGAVATLFCIYTDDAGNQLVVNRPAGCDGLASTNLRACS